MSYEIPLKFTLFAVHAIADGSHVSRVLMATRSKEFFDKACAAVEQIRATAPKVRAGNPSNAKGVKVLGIADAPRASNAMRGGKLTLVPKPGTCFASVGDCAREMGLSPAGLRQTFFRARKAANGFDEPVTVYGVRLALIDGETDRVSL